MNLLEFEAKSLLRDAGLPVPDGTLLGPDDAVKVDHPNFVKAQVPFGGRGKQGLVLPADSSNALQVVQTIRERMRALGLESPRVLLEHPQSVADMVDFIVARILDQLRVPHTLGKRWGGAV